MRQLGTLLAVFLSANTAFCAISASTVWQVSTTGNDNFGGGFVAGATGTDYSKSSSAHVVFDGSTISASAAGITATITIAGYTVATSDIGNNVNITGGSGFTTGIYNITSVSGNTWTLDRNATTGAASGMTGNMGGWHLTIAKALGVMVGGNKIFVKNDGVYSISSALAFGTSGNIQGSGGTRSRLIGYTSSLTDKGQPVIRASGSGYNILNVTGQGIEVENFILDCNKQATCTGASLTGNYNEVANLHVTSFTVYGITSQGTLGGEIYDCEVTSGTAAATAAISLGSGQFVIRSSVHDNNCPGIFTASNGNTETIADTIIANNTGASSDGVFGADTYGDVITHCVIYGNGRDGIRMSDGYNIGLNVRNNIIAKNGGWGFENSAGNWPADYMYDGNAYWSNGSGNRNGVDDTTSFPINAIGAYTNPQDVILSADPFTNSSGEVFTLNNTAGGGAAVRGAGTPGLLPGFAQLGYVDMGPYQHQQTTATYGAPYAN